jgi:hypothetical protein
MNRTSLFVGALLVILGGVFIAINFVPALTIHTTWPAIFFFIALIMILPVFIWPESKRGLSGMIIPATILAVLGAIFLYNVLTHDWLLWAYGWILIPGSVGLGLALASKVGHWEHETVIVGTWMGIISLALFCAFAAIFGGTIIKTIGAAVLILTGAGLLARSFIKPTSQTTKAK